MSTKMIEDIKALRKITDAPLKECKAALELKGTFEDALELIQKGGLKIKDSVFDRKIKSGVICSYIHNESQVGVLLHIGCETDFVARTKEFLQLANDIAMHIAAAHPRYISKEDIPSEALEAFMTKHYDAAKATGKPESIIQKIIDGKLNSFYEQECLIHQIYIKSDDITIDSLLKKMITNFGENIKIMRFQRYEV